MRVAGLHMHIDEMGAPDASLQTGALVVRSRRRHNHYCPANRSRAAAALTQNALPLVCTVSVLTVPDGCFSAECRSVIAAHQQEQPVPGRMTLDGTNTWVIADQVDYEEQDSARSEEDAEDGTKDGSE